MICRDFVCFDEFVGVQIDYLTYSHGHMGRDDLNDDYGELNTHVYSDFLKSSMDVAPRPFDENSQSRTGSSNPNFTASSVKISLGVLFCAIAKLGRNGLGVAGYDTWSGESAGATDAWAEEATYYPHRLGEAAEHRLYTSPYCARTCCDCYIYC